jgi:hypothetical protein
VFFAEEVTQEIVEECAENEVDRALRHLRGLREPERHRSAYMGERSLGHDFEGTRGGLSVEATRGEDPITQRSDSRRRPGHCDGSRSPLPHPQVPKHISVWHVESASAAVSHPAVESAAQASRAVSQLVVE